MSENEPNQRFAKALDTFASSDIIRLLAQAEDLATLQGEYDTAFARLDDANGRLPQNVRIKEPSEQYQEMIQEKEMDLADFRLLSHSFARLSQENLNRVYFFQYLGPLCFQKFKEVKKQIIDAMQAKNMYFQEINRRHNSDAPQTTVL